MLDCHGVALHVSSIFSAYFYILQSANIYLRGVFSLYILYTHKKAFSSFLYDKVWHNELGIVIAVSDTRTCFVHLQTHRSLGYIFVGIFAYTQKIHSCIKTLKKDTSSLHFTGSRIIDRQARHKHYLVHGCKLPQGFKQRNNGNVYNLIQLKRRAIKSTNSEGRTRIITASPTAA